jgi:hypothetical protein
LTPAAIDLNQDASSHCGLTPLLRIGSTQKMEDVMAIAILTYTLPSDSESLRQYAGKVPGWINTVLSAPGAKEFRAYRSVDGKQVMTVTENESVATAKNFLSSDTWKAMRGEFEKLGCSNIQTNIWDTSPLVPQAKQPNRSAA